ncbi:MAG: molybdopterin-dependent oxidoreductase [Pyrinomonadaceae bacterium]
MSERDNEILVEKVRELEHDKPDDKANTAKILGERRYLSEPLSETQASRRMSALSRRGFLVGGAAALIGVLGWRWMPDDTKYDLLRRTFEFNERVSQLFYKPAQLAPEFPLAQVTKPSRVNGDMGMTGEFDAASWRLTIGGLANRTDELVLTLDDIKRLPRTEMTTEFKCIEGWSTIVNWGGVRFSDLVAEVMPGISLDNLPAYVSMTTPDKNYFVGWDIQAIMHPQTLLAYEMNGEPLRPDHGAPLRLASPTKYGIKQIKRIGRIEFTADRPRDYWAEQGYDWYAGF